MTEQLDTVVIGAGVVGLACAHALARSGREVVVLESTASIGSGTSSRNSEVIHAGIYYPTDSLKARACVAGKHALYAYCAERGIAHRRCGKFIVATGEAQLATLEQLRLKAAANGVPDLAWMSPDELREREPAIRCVGALHSPTSGIIDSHSLMLAYQGDLESAGGMLALLSPLEDGEVRDDGIVLRVGGDEPMEIQARTVVNCAGLHASEVARRIRGLPADSIPQTYYAKGNYYTLLGRSPFSRLIYPVPEQAGLGVHVTIDLGNQARFGPDVEWVETLDYDVDPRRAEVFYDAVRRYWPELPDGALVPGYAGIRPKLQPPGEPARDFLIQGPASHGVAGLVNLYGIESPGLTASLALADEVVALLDATTA